MTPLAPGTDAQRELAGACERFFSGSSVNYRGQTTLTDGVRDALGLKARDRERYVVTEESVLMMPVWPTSRRRAAKNKQSDKIGDGGIVLSYDLGEKTRGRLLILSG